MHGYVRFGFRKLGSLDFGAAVVQVPMLYFLGNAHNSLSHFCGEDTRFAVVWVQQSNHRVGPWMAWRFSESLHEKYAKNLEAAH